MEWTDRKKKYLFGKFEIKTKEIGRKQNQKSISKESFSNKALRATYDSAMCTVTGNLFVSAVATNPKLYFGLLFHIASESMADIQAVVLSVLFISRVLSLTAFQLQPDSNVTRHLPLQLLT